MNVLPFLIFIGMGLGCFWYAWIQSFDLDTAWKWHVQRQRSQGVKAEMLERTKEWEQQNYWFSCNLLGVGLFFVFMGFVLLLSGGN